MNYFTIVVYSGLATGMVSRNIGFSLRKNLDSQCIKHYFLLVKQILLSFENLIDVTQNNYVVVNTKS